MHPAFKIRQWLHVRIRSFSFELMRLNWLGYSPGSSEILSHFELIPDAVLTQTLTRYNEIQSQSKNKNCDSISIKLWIQNLQHTILVH